MERRAVLMSVCAWQKSNDPTPSPPENVGVGHVGFSPTTHTVLALSAERCDVSGELREE